MTSLATSLQEFDPSLLEAARRRLEREQERRLEINRLESSLIDFVEGAWSQIDPSEYQQCWAIDALCEHLQAVTEGKIPRLLVNFPPRCGKTNVTSICFQAWTWARRVKTFLSGPQVRFLCGSYNDDLALQNSMMQRRLVLSPWYQERWGNRYGITLDQNTKSKFDTTVGGSRVSTSARGSLLGIGGDVIVIDDPHNTKQAESEAERHTALTWWREISTTRLNDPKRSALVVIMQRLNEEDVSGIILSGDTGDDWVHLCIPMEYDWPRHNVTALGWQDPRGLDEDDEPLVIVTPDGERRPRDRQSAIILDDERQHSLMWPERFGPNEVAKIKAGLGPYMASGRLQQMPVPDRGGIFQRLWWQLWDPDDGKFPTFEFLLASLDGAFTSKEENDPSALTVWGLFTDKDGRRRLMLVKAWRKFLQFSADRSLLEPLPQGPRFLWAGDHFRENREWLRWRQQTQEHWGLIEWVEDTCSSLKVDRLLIEDKASGLPAIDELRNRYGRKDWAIEAVTPTKDKVARALAVQPTFSQQMVYAPAREWSELVIDEMSVFPKGRFDDITDSATQAVKWLRDRGMLETDEETHAAEMDGVMHKPQPKPLYGC